MPKFPYIEASSGARVYLTFNFSIFGRSNRMNYKIGDSVCWDGERGHVYALNKDIGAVFVEIGPNRRHEQWPAMEVMLDPQGIALDAFFAERRFQDEKHGPLNNGGSHTIGEWILLMEAELAEAKRALLKGGKGRDSVLSEIIQVGALALAAIEQHGTGEIVTRSI